MHFTNIKFEKFTNRTSVYPPSVMVKDSTKRKDEERWIKNSEKVYSLSNPLLGEMRQSYKDLMVCSLFLDNIKDTYLAGMIGIFGAYLEFSFKYLKTEFNKDPDLKMYFNENYSEFEDIHKSSFDIMRNSTCASPECVDSYKIKFKETTDALKKRFK